MSAIFALLATIAITEATKSEGFCACGYPGGLCSGCRFARDMRERNASRAPGPQPNRAQRRKGD